MCEIEFHVTVRCDFGRQHPWVGSVTDVILPCSFWSNGTGAVTAMEDECLVAMGCVFQRNTQENTIPSIGVSKGSHGHSWQSILVLRFSFRSSEAASHCLLPRKIQHKGRASLPGSPGKANGIKNDEEGIRRPCPQMKWDHQEWLVDIT